MSRIQHTTGISETTLEAETFLVDSQGREVYYLDAISSALWRLLAEPQSLESCLAVFAAAFPELPPERLARDLEKALADFETHALVTRVP